jgi:general stress protein 26
MNESSKTGEILQFEELVRSIGVALLTTRQADGHLHTRPLQTLRIAESRLWFFTDAASPKTEEIRHELQVSVSYADIVGHRYATASGTGEVLRDAALARDLWQVDQRAYYPDGPDDAHLAILTVRIERAEYWLAPGRISYLLAAAQAALTGQAITRIGENHKL